jgi:MFS family permease
MLKQLMSRRFLTITMVSLSFWLSVSLYMPILPLLMRSYEYSMIDIGLVMLASSVGVAIFEPITGVYSDKIGVKKIIIIGSVLKLFTVLMYTFATQLWEFAIINFLSAAASAGISSPTRAYIGQVTSKAERGKGYGTYMSILGLGRVFGPPIGGYLAQNVSYNFSFYASSITLIASLIFAFYLPKSGKVEDENKVNNTLSHPKWKDVLTIGLFLLLLLRMSSVFNFRFERTIMPVYITENPNFLASETEVGLILGLMAIVGIFSNLLLGHLVDRFGRKKIIILGMLLCSFSFSVFVFIDNLTQVYMTVSVLAVGQAALYLGLIVHLTHLVPRSHYGTAIGLFGLSEDTGGMISSVLVGYLYDVFGVTPVFYVLATNMLLAALVAFITLKDKFKSKKTISK